MNNETKVKVTNRSYGSVSYKIPDLNISRTFEVGETKTLTVEELMKLSCIPGGKPIIEKYLIIDNEELINELLGEVEPEYFYTKEDIVILLQNGSLDQLDDCLTFGGESIVDLVKNTAVEIEVNDVKKRELIFAKTGYNINNAIDIKHSLEADDVEEVQTTRKATPITKTTSATATGRKAATPKYKVTSMSTK